MLEIMYTLLILTSVSIKVNCTNYCSVTLSYTNTKSVQVKLISLKKDLIGKTFTKVLVFFFRGCHSFQRGWGFSKMKLFDNTKWLVFNGHIKE